MNEQTVVYFVLILAILALAQMLRLSPGPPVSRRYVVASVAFAAVSSWVFGHWDIEPHTTLREMMVGNLVVAALPGVFVKEADDTGYWTWRRLGANAAFYYAALMAVSLVPRMSP